MFDCAESYAGGQSEIEMYVIMRIADGFFLLILEHIEDGSSRSSTSAVRTLS